MRGVFYGKLKFQIVPEVDRYVHDHWISLEFNEKLQMLTAEIVNEESEKSFRRVIITYKDLKELFIEANVREVFISERDEELLPLVYPEKRVYADVYLRRYYEKKY